MKKLTVCGTITYYYEVEVPDWFTEKDKDGTLDHERLLLETCFEADPTILEGVNEYERDISSIYEDNGLLYD